MAAADFGASMDFEPDNAKKKIFVFDTESIHPNQAAAKTQAPKKRPQRQRGTRSSRLNRRGPGPWLSPRPRAGREAAVATLDKEAHGEDR